jgi:hypothetical protein
MKYEHLTPKQLLASAKILEIITFIVLGVFVALWWLPAYTGAQHPISKQQATIFFVCLWFLFLNPITRLGFSHLRAGYKHFTKGEGSFISLKLRIFIVAVGTIGYFCGLYLSA